MLKHAGIVRPKFELVLDMFDKELSGLGICEWIKPNGGLRTPDPFVTTYGRLC